MTDETDDTINLLLREAFEGPVPDAGFSDQVSARLPARAPTRRWPLAAGIAAGTAFSAAALSQTPIAAAGWHDWLSGQRTTPALVLLAAMALMALLTLAWAAVEADDAGGAGR